MNNLEHMRHDEEDQYEDYDFQDPQAVYDDTHLWKAEANVDSEIKSTKPTLKVVREEVINGKVYKVMSI